MPQPWKRSPWYDGSGRMWSALALGAARAALGVAGGVARSPAASANTATAVAATPPSGPMTRLLIGREGIALS